MSAADLRKMADIAPNTMTRMKKDQEVTIQVLERICKILDTDFGEIIEYIPDHDINEFCKSKNVRRQLI